MPPEFRARRGAGVGREPLPQSPTSSCQRKRCLRSPRHTPAKRRSVDVAPTGAATTRAGDAEQDLRQLREPTLKATSSVGGTPQITVCGSSSEPYGVPRGYRRQPGAAPLAVDLSRRPRDHAPPSARVGTIAALPEQARSSYDAPLSPAPRPHSASRPAEISRVPWMSALCCN